MFNRRKPLTEAISIESDGRTIDAPFVGEKWLLDVVIDADVDIGHTCGGMGTCGTCKIEVLSGLELFDERNEIEIEMAEIRAYAPEERLACQSLARTGMKIRVP